MEIWQCVRMVDWCWTYEIEGKQENLNIKRTLTGDSSEAWKFQIRKLGFPKWDLDLDQMEDLINSTILIFCHSSLQTVNKTTHKFSRIMILRNVW